MSTTNPAPQAPKRPRGRPRGSSLTILRARIPTTQFEALDRFAADYTARVGTPMDRSGAARLVLTAGFQALGVSTEKQG